MQGLMTPRASKVLSLTGLFLLANTFSPSFRAMSKGTEDSIMKVPGLCYVQLDSIGPMRSKFFPAHIFLLTDHYFCGHRVKASLRNGDFMVAGDQWPLLVYKDYVYDPENPWAGVFRSSILVKVSFTEFFVSKYSFTPDINKSYKHIFTSPSSAEQEAKATRSGNARIHGMTRVTKGSLAYVATQVGRLSQCTAVID